MYTLDLNHNIFSLINNYYDKKKSCLINSSHIFLVLNNKNEIHHNLLPIIKIDLWNHSCYLDFLDKKNKYINKIFSIIDFGKINKNYEKAL